MIDESVIKKVHPTADILQANDDPCWNGKGFVTVRIKTGSRLNNKGKPVYDLDMWSFYAASQSAFKGKEEDILRCMLLGFSVSKTIFHDPDEKYKDVPACIPRISIHSGELDLEAIARAEIEDDDTQS